MRVVGEENDVKDVFVLVQLVKEGLDYGVARSIWNPGQKSSPLSENEYSGKEYPSMRKSSSPA